MEGPEDDDHYVHECFQQVLVLRTSCPDEFPAQPPEVNAPPTIS